MLEAFVQLQMKNNKPIKLMI